MGLRPEQFIFIRESHPLRRMAACEEALGTKGLSAIIHEYGPLYEKTDLWGKSARRLQLACERGSATAFLIGAPAPASGFESAWHITLNAICARGNRLAPILSRTTNPCQRRLSCLSQSDMG